MQSKDQFDSFGSALQTALENLRHTRESFSFGPSIQEVGTVISVLNGVALVSGLPGVGFEEVVRFPENIFGIAFSLDQEEVGVILLGDSSRIRAGEQVERTGRVMDAPVGDELLGRVIDPLGQPLDGKEPIRLSKHLPIERPAPAILDRAPVTEPLQTGIKVIDALIPIGHGQRELIMGDRQTGKTAIAIDTIINQKGKDVWCFYCAIGQRASTIAKLVSKLRSAGAMEYTVVVVAEGNDAPGMKYVAPYAATTMAEHFMEQGKRVLIVYDDLTHHARAYRELCLLLRRPPGREAFPADIFYIHSRLLERATHLNEKLRGGSLTALPVVETEAQNIAAFIPTNLISITDGQIYLSPTLFQLGNLPAVDVGKSVSRVGGKAQGAAYRELAADLKLSYSQFEELEVFARFGTRLDEHTQRTLEHGRRIRACLNQPQYEPMTVEEQLVVLQALNAKLFDQVSLKRMIEAEKAVRGTTNSLPPAIRQRLSFAESLGESDTKIILEALKTSIDRLEVAQ